MSTASPILRIFDAHDAGLPVAIGVPFPRGTVKSLDTVGLAAPDGSRVPVAARQLARWPDGSCRWALLAAAVKHKGDYTVIAKTEGKPPAITNAVKLGVSSDAITLSNGLVTATLAATGRGPLRRVEAHGHAWLASAESTRLVVDAASSLHEGKRTLQVLERSPLRARVRVEGEHRDPSGARKFTYRLDVELWANWPTLRLDYHFFNVEPGHEELPVDRIAMEFDLAMGPATQRHLQQSVHGLRYVPREVVNPAKVALVADETRGPTHVEDVAMLLDDVKYPIHLRPPLVDTADWLGIGDDKRSVYVRMQDFANTRPKRLVSDGSSLVFEVWPARAGRMIVPQGRSKRQVITLAFAEKPRLAVGEATRLLDAPLHEGRACLDPAWLRHTGEFDLGITIESGVHVRIEKFLRRLASLSTPQSMFDLGDTPDSGYLRTYTPLGTAQEPVRNAPALPRVFLAGAHSPLAEWAMPNLYEPVWTNNEYDAIHCICTHLMRMGLPDSWQLVRWMVRHNIEVDFVHYHDDLQQNRATPQHSARHTRTGAIPSHFWTQGLLQYYCLTGDHDVLEIARALGDKIIEDLTHPELRPVFWGFTRELGWPTLALAHLVDITGEAKYEAMLKEIIDFFVGYDRRKFHGQVNLSGTNARHSLERQMISSFFGYACMIEGVDHYQRRTGREDVKKWLVQILHELRDALDATHREGWPTGTTHMHGTAMAIGYEQTGDPRFLSSGMVSVDELVESAQWDHPTQEVKPTAMIYRGFVRFLHHAHEAGLLDRLEYPAALTHFRGAKPASNTTSAPKKKEKSDARKKKVARGGGGRGGGAGRRRR